MESTRVFLHRQLTTGDYPWYVLGVFVLAIALLYSCNVQHQKSTTDLGLHQAAGRQLYAQYCVRCHEPHSSHAQRGPSLHGIFQKPLLSRSGMPANDEHVGQMITTGRDQMPAFSGVLSPEQVQDVVAYLHTL